jgi:hypothetical protein
MTPVWNAIARLVVDAVWGLDRVVEFANVTHEERS